MIRFDAAERSERIARNSLAQTPDCYAFYAHQTCRVQFFP